ncbi:WD40-repeat-containing domain protein [Blyttiomyces helicus]|uniref:Katanin p80 WD40 repeat-containing subunit B1 homolog n=1 Tax=Blyttiomyces helicus TaxID=388810 RepID=A0A4P9WKN7_9FUNG|nr:WD40-repeat-containing domain protein [Blyttiomyces helicus]|eukprot:RKO92583.1 WD40-repeat-containing domain protein [Blyttiomyces helicus]
MVTGGEDRKVNLWAVGRTTPILSLAGHANAIECVTLDWPEEIVVAGSSSGTIKLWDLEHAKGTFKSHTPTRILVSGGRCITVSKATASLEFHPFGDFFASGSVDRLVKVWDVRRKGCIQTYTGHSGTVRILRITPDGRWIVSGGEDGLVKLWDMTAGKLLQTFADHAGSIRSLALNPSEFLLATAGADRMLRFYDLQTFECVSSSDLSNSAAAARGVVPSSAGSPSIWQWEPAMCRDVIPASWQNVADIRVVAEDDKLIGATLDQNFVGMWGIDLSRSPVETNVAPSKKAFASMPHPDITESPRLHRDEVPIKHRASADDLREVRRSDEDEPVKIGTLQPKPTSSQSKGGYPASAPSSNATFGSRGLGPADDHEDFGEEDRGWEPGSGRASTETGATAVEDPRPSFIGAGSGEKILNLDLGKFVQNTRGRGPFIPLSFPTHTPPPLPGSLTQHTTQITNVLLTRLAMLRTVRAAWDEGNIRPALEAMIECGDAAVRVDVLRVVNLRPKLWTLEGCALVLPMLVELLFEVYEDYIATACATTRVLCKSFAPMILSALDSSATVSPGVDLVREDRIARCKACHRSFVDLAITLDELKRSSGKVGITVRETLGELDVFLKGRPMM